MRRAEFACFGADSNEAMGERPGRKFVYDPGAVRTWPRCRQFQIREPGRHARDRVAAGDVVSSNYTNQPATEPRGPVPPRLAGNEGVRPGGNGRQ